MGAVSNDDKLDVFSRFFAVVLDHRKGSGYRVVWSSDHKGWLRNRDYRTGSGIWMESPGEMYGDPDGPAEGDRALAVTLASDFTRTGAAPCKRCSQDAPDLHFIAPNVYGNPEMYCVQVPSYTVVESKGGSGQKKHWGSPFGCRSVEYEISAGSEQGDYLGPLAVYLFGQPLPALEVIGREWCSKCQVAAYNVRENALREGASQTEWARDSVERQVRNVARVLGKYYGEK